jgi:hypothetical protein
MSKFSKWVQRRANIVMGKRKPDLIIEQEGFPYLKRWWLIPRNPIFNMYLHVFLQSDRDALHDHPWLFNASYIVEGEYTEMTPADDPWGNVVERCQYPVPNVRREGEFKFRWGRAPHRVVLPVNKNFFMPGVTMPATTIFITGPRIREWGFYPETGWQHWKKFLGIDYDYNEKGSARRKT